MLCLQCGKEAVYSETVQGVKVNKCIDGHMTGLLSQEQEEEIQGQMLFKKAV